MLNEALIFILLHLSSVSGRRERHSVSIRPRHIPNASLKVEEGSTLVCRCEPNVSLHRDGCSPVLSFKQGPQGGFPAPLNCCKCDI